MTMHVRIHTPWWEIIWRTVHVDSGEVKVESYNLDIEDE